LGIDCDVLQADGGTRTASITGAFVALQRAMQKLIDDKKLTESPLITPVAAVSVGIVDGQPLLDLCFTEDVGASVDMNLVMTGAGEFVEVQGTGEESSFTEQELAAMIALGKKGIRELLDMQQAAV
jgi:ribonuclease PH